MKNKFALGILAAGLLSAGVLAGCGKKNNTPVQVEFSFTVSLSNGSKFLNKGEEASINIDEYGGNPNDPKDYEISTSNPSVLTVNNSNRSVYAVEKGDARITVKEKYSNKTQSLSLSVTDAKPANGGFNYASLTGDDAVAKRTQILGELEKYAMDNHLTGIPLFENSGYVKYSSRVTLPTHEYITGYGFGLLSEGSIDAPMEKEDKAQYKYYLHSSTSAPDPNKINARNDKGSQVGDLEGYITSSFWGTKLNSTKNGYVWYPVLAKNTVTYNGKTTAFDRPIPMYEDKTKPLNDPARFVEVAPGTELDPLGQYKTWRIYVKTGADGIKFRYQGASWGIDFDQRDVTLADYEFAYRFLLTASHGQERGTEMANDETYGIYGARKYNDQTKETTDEDAATLWNNMKNSHSLGFASGHDDTNGDYIQLTLLNPIDRFTAMYTLSSNLLSPMNEEFIRTIGQKGGDKALAQGAKNYGLTNDNKDAPAGHRGNIVDYVLSVGPYMLEKWDVDQAIFFKKNHDWDTIEPGRYNIEGVKLLIVDTSSSVTAVYDLFNSGLVDSCGIPSKIKIINEELAKGENVYQTKGDSTFKLNVNSCTIDEWNRQFGPGGEISTQGNFKANWDVKPWMSNDNFLNGIFYSIDRKTFAANRGVQPTINYFSNAYLNDPEKGLSYNDSPEHAAAVEAYQTYDADHNPTYGYSRDRAILCFQAAVKELLKMDYTGYQDKFKVVNGSKDKPFIITFHIKWMNQTDPDEYGKDIIANIEDAFNDERVCGGLIKLKITQDAVYNWSDVYYEYLMKGQYDLGFGAISGNTYNPLNFLEVLKSNNSSGFTLNWGTDTSKISRKKPLIYEDKMWSFDALWAVADHGGVVDEGSIAKSVEMTYIYGRPNNAFYEGLDFYIATKFIDFDSAQFDITRVQIYVRNRGGTDVEFETYTTPLPDIEEGSDVIKISLSAATADSINQLIREAFKMNDMDRYPKLYNETPFTLENYGIYWWVELTYSTAIKPEGATEFGAPSETSISVSKNYEDAEADALQNN